MKLMTFRAQIFVGGELTTKAAAGPWDFEHWRKCLRVFRTVMLKLNASPLGPLDAYEEGLRQLFTGFPQYSPWLKTNSVRRGGRR